MRLIFKITNQFRSGSGCLVCRATACTAGSWQILQIQGLKTQFAAFVLVYLASPSPQPPEPGWVIAV